ncbi:MAG: hypothetical protein JWQ49_3813 [Edaphobacter sp.]|nr:hypothetical protein [Edaphobacter sp.]
MKAIVDKLLRSTSSPRRLSKLLKAPVLPWSYSQTMILSHQKCGRTGISPGRRCFS